ncbi:VOC family protein [Roseivirga thermotolerans]|uniref:VOC family protein n=1 Tax=Roseivirga thermotolerans TaxID=1758176 RepID=UPI00273F0733|nr:VOC family protein [Roseivirga thermotolerans]
MKKIFLQGIFALLLCACTKPGTTDLVSFEVYCEMVANGAKPIALSHPMTMEEADLAMPEFAQVARKNNLYVYREDNFPVSALFPAETTRERSVFVIFKDSLRLEQYRQLKQDIAERRWDDQLLARRMGRLLGYSTQGINHLLMENTAFRTINSFGIKEQTTHLYYNDLARAKQFYAEQLGFTPLEDNRFQISSTSYIQLHALSAEHPKEQPKSTAIALLTDQLPEWYAYVQKLGIPIKYSYKPKEGGPHDGFVAIDPEGYLLEFEQFKQHQENELLMAALSKVPYLTTTVDSLGFYGSITWTYHQDLLAQQNYYQEVLGFEMVADQGWTKIFQTSHSSFIGLVDERRGMENYANEKAVEIGWKVERLEALQNYLRTSNPGFSGSLIGPELYAYRFY